MTPLRNFEADLSGPSGLGPGTSQSDPAAASDAVRVLRNFEADQAVTRPPAAGGDAWSSQPAQAEHRALLVLVVSGVEGWTCRRLSTATGISADSVYDVVRRLHCRGDVDAEFGQPYTADEPAERSHFTVTELGRERLLSSPLGTLFRPQRGVSGNPACHESTSTSVGVRSSEPSAEHEFPPSPQTSPEDSQDSRVVRNATPASDEPPGLVTRCGFVLASAEFSPSGYGLWGLLLAERYGPGYHVVPLDEVATLWGIDRSRAANKIRDWRRQRRQLVHSAGAQARPGHLALWIPDPQDPGMLRFFAGEDLVDQFKRRLDANVEEEQDFARQRDEGWAPWSEGQRRARGEPVMTTEEKEARRADTARRVAAHNTLPSTVAETTSGHGLRLPPD